MKKLQACCCFVGLCLLGCSSKGETSAALEQAAQKSTEQRLERLEAQMATLDERMQEALWALACGETTERALAEEWQLSKSTFHDRKVRALKLLRAELAARGYGRLDH